MTLNKMAKDTSKPILNHKISMITDFEYKVQQDRLSTNKNALHNISNNQQSDYYCLSEFSLR